MQLAFKDEARQLAALANLKAACSGRARRALRDQPAVVSRLVALSSSPSVKVKAAVMDAFRCTSPKMFVKPLEVQLADKDPKVVSYASEVAARVADPAVGPALLLQLEARDCMQAKLPKDEIEACVWLTYAPGAVIESADAALREKAAALAVKHFESPHAKVREVAVETVASSRVKAHAPALKALIAAEQTKKFEQPNDAALLGRFNKRLSALRRAR